jgi:hypothetical protein
VTPTAARATHAPLQSRIGNQINDGAFDAMIEAIQTDRTPNFYFMQDELPTWRAGGIGRDDLMARLSEELCESSTSTT